MEAIVLHLMHADGAYMITGLGRSPAGIAVNSERAFVIRVKDGVAEWVNVKRGPAQGDLIEVYGPLENGDVILRRGSDEIREGRHLNVRLAKP